MEIETLRPSDCDMQTILDGVRIAYDDCGSGDAIVLLHGFPFDRTVWAPQRDVLARSYRVICPDLRGSGDSARGEGPALMETLAGDVFALLEQLRIERAVVAGHSMGGYVALAYFRMYAERVAGLALITSNVAADPPEFAAARDRLAAELRAGSMAPALAVLPRLFAGVSLARDPGLLERAATIVAGQDPLGAAAQVIGMKERVGSEDLLEDIAVPLLLVGGDADALMAAGVHERTAAAVPDGEYVGLPDCGHLPMFEAPEALGAALVRFSARCAAASADRRSVRADRA